MHYGALTSTNLWRPTRELYGQTGPWGSAQYPATYRRSAGYGLTLNSLNPLSEDAGWDLLGASGKCAKSKQRLAYWQAQKKQKGATGKILAHIAKWKERKKMYCGGAGMTLEDFDVNGGYEAPLETPFTEGGDVGASATSVVPYVVVGVGLLALVGAAVAYRRKK